MSDLSVENGQLSLAPLQLFARGCATRSSGAISATAAARSISSSMLQSYRRLLKLAEGSLSTRPLVAQRNSLAANLLRPLLRSEVRLTPGDVKVRLLGQRRDVPSGNTNAVLGDP